MRKTRKVPIVCWQRGKIVFWTTKEQMIGGKIKWLRFCWKTSVHFHKFTRHNFAPTRGVDSFIKTSSSVDSSRFRQNWQHGWQFIVELIVNSQIKVGVDKLSNYYPDVHFRSRGRMQLSALDRLLDARHFVRQRDKNKKVPWSLKEKSLGSLHWRWRPEDLKRVGVSGGREGGG